MHVKILALLAIGFTLSGAGEHTRCRTGVSLAPHVQPSEPKGKRSAVVATSKRAASNVLSGR